MNGFSAVATARVDSAERVAPSTLASMPSTHLVRKSSAVDASSEIEPVAPTRLRAISGMRTLSSNWPCMPP
ncbi:MAG: hypothetical protein QOC54_2214, partial [Baekduia sp.]|nr:hypothetical protein [Baekduia sp.]